MFIYIYMPIYQCICTYVYTCLYISWAYYAKKSLGIRYIYMYIHIFKYIKKHLCIYMYIYICLYINVYVRMYIHVYIYPGLIMLKNL
jgi:hypothetical protein